MGDLTLGIASGARDYLLPVRGQPASRDSSDHLMSSHSGNLQHLAAFSGHPSFIIGSESEPDSSSRQAIDHQHPPIQSEMGLRYINTPAPDDARFSPDSGTSQSPVYCVESNTQASTPSTIPYSSYPYVYTPVLTGSPPYSINSSPFFPNNPNQSPSEIKPDLASLNAYSAMAPPSRSPHLPQLGSPANVRDLYGSATPQLRRTAEHLSRSPSASGTLRGAPHSPSSSSGFASPANMENSQLGSKSEGPPPLQPTELLLQLQTADGQQVRPEILGKIDKGFFLAENDWTCYRRNYFQLSCSYTLHPYLPQTTAIDILRGGQTYRVHGFAMSIAAVVDGRDGRPIDLVQHTPKRDKGPQNRPDRVTLLPRPPPSLYGEPTSRSMFDGPYPQNANQTPTEHTFERIQFKQATANNGKRRAAQQYYHLLVELYADLGSQMGDGRWVKIAQRVSAQMVVRGRSPGHYHAERRGSNASTGPGGSAGQSSAPGSFSSGGLGRGPEPMSLSSSTSIVQGGGYGPSYDSRSRHYLTTALGKQIEIPIEPIWSNEDVKGFEDTPSYLYYPSAINEANIGSHLRSQNLPSYHSTHREEHRGHLSVADYAHNPDVKIKQEFQHTGFTLPSLTAGPPDSFSRHCGRFEGVPTTRGYYPTTIFTHPEINSA